MTTSFHRYFQSVATLPPLSSYASFQGSSVFSCRGSRLGSSTRGSNDETDLVICGIRSSWSLFPVIYSITITVFQFVPYSLRHQGRHTVLMDIPPSTGTHITANLILPQIFVDLPQRQLATSVALETPPARSRLAESIMMELYSSPKSAASSNSNTAPSSVSKPPTYTTAGTIYNPSSSQPLQPPARRSRAKWVGGSATSDLVLLPKSALASLPLRAFTSSVRPPTYQQYMPLQQNYDRAVGPFIDSDYKLFGMANEPLQMRNGNMPAPSSAAFAKPDQRKEEENNETDEEESDDEQDERNPLYSLPVKSLHNLASYPNPNQKKAHKALLRGSKPKLGNVVTAPRSGAPLSSPSWANDPTESMSGTYGLSEFANLTRAKSAALDRYQNDGQAGIDDSRVSTARLVHPRPLRPMAYNGTTDISGKVTTLANGPGAPRPLTAGPPGLRQYRPSTFESTFKALHSRPALGDQPYGVGQTPVLAKPGAQDTQMKSLAGFFPPFLSNELASTNAQLTGRLSQASGMSMGLHPASDRDGEKLLEEANVVDDAIDVNGQAAYETWKQLQPNAGEVGVPRMAIRTSDDIARRNEEINDYWYAGTNDLFKSIDDVIEESHQRKSAARFGAIGDGRPTKKIDSHSALSIEEANRQQLSEHVDPLLNMAFASLLRISEETASGSTFRQFDSATQASSDHNTDDPQVVFGKNAMTSGQI